MPEPEKSRRRAVLLVVLGIIVVVLAVMLLIGVLRGDDTEEPAPQTARVAASEGALRV